MDFSEILRESSLTLSVNKIRTTLAMLGVIIGIGSVIALMSLGQATQKSITSQIQALGSNLLTVMPGTVNRGGISQTSARETLSLADAQAIKTEIPLVSEVSPIISGNAQLVAGRNNTNSQIYGVSPAYMTVNNLKIASGNFISERHLPGISKVAVIGPEIASEIFPEGTNVLGQQLRINNQSFTIIGTTVKRGGSGFLNPDSLVFIPLTTAQSVLFGQTHLSSLGISIRAENFMTQAQEEITQLLLKRHKITDPENADFRIMNQEDILTTVTQVAGTFTTLLSGIAAISLIVGGIGIMNIMLVTVTERTREIGLRKALGAKRRYIIAQFLTEAVLITFIGGLIGILIGILISFILCKTMNLPFTVLPISIILAFGVSVFTGIIFGWYPAQKAAKLQPIDALRYE